MPAVGRIKLFCLLGLSLFGMLNLPLRADPPPGKSAAVIEAENQVTVKHGSAAWVKPASLPSALDIGDRVQTGELSRAAVRLTDSSVLRLDELTSVEIVPPPRESDKEGLDISAGATYFFSREKPRELEVRTPSATGALRGTEFVVRVTGTLTQLTMIDGEVVLSNAAGSVVLHSGEQGEAELGRAPHKTAVIEATNIIQWCLYYPGVLDPRDLGVSKGESDRVTDSLAAYNAGDLLGALEKYPTKAFPQTAPGRLYFAAVLLAVGRVDDAQKEMSGVPASAPGRRAIEQMIAAVKFEDWNRPGEPTTVSEWMAQSYYQQSRGDLEKARASALKATTLAPDFGYAWVRLAELEFSFGRIPDALKALDRGLASTPRNAQGYALRGFLLSAENEIDRARDCFNMAINLDGALANAWLGRGLTYIRQGQDETGRRDLQAAAALEPNRSILRSYLGKAFSDVGNTKNAVKDLTRAKELDPKDPTPWLYSAIQNKQENRYNQAIDDLEESIALNDNRRVYRSRFLLDQDRSIRGTNLAAIYLNDGMVDQSVREAVLAVDADYSSAPAHLFLSNSYNALRDPTRILLRYETPWFNELLLSNLLSPVGGGPLSQFVSEQEYSKMFEKDGFGVSSTFNYYSFGEFEETASQYGTFGNFSYALDTQLFYNGGQRANNQISRHESYGQFKYQLGPQDTLFFQTKLEDLSNGDVFQVYNQDSVNSSTADQTQRFHESQVPGLLLFGYHHEWSPGDHTLLLIGRLEDHQVQTAQDTSQAAVTRDVTAFTNNATPPADPNNPFTDPSVYATLSALTGKGQILDINDFPLDLSYVADFVTYTAEFQQILTFDSDTVVFGSRAQDGEFDTSSSLQNLDPNIAPIYSNSLAQQNFNVGLQRINVYAYDTWHIAPWLSLTGGVTYDDLLYPENFRTPPINGAQQRLDKVSPKAGLILQPAKGTTFRAAYAQAISGASFDESVRLEPTEVAGFTQAYRTIASESLLGSVAGSTYDILGFSLEQKLPTHTYLGLEFDDLKQNVNRTLGVFDSLSSFNGYPTEMLPSSLAANDHYHEQIYTATINQLVGEDWSFGARYSYTNSYLNQQIPELQSTPLPTDPTASRDISTNASNSSRSGLTQVVFSALFNHPSGFFSTADAKWYKQDNGSINQLTTAPPGDDFWQFDWTAGYRFYRNQCEVSVGVLDINNENYQLDPLNPYEELPRSRTFFTSIKFAF